MKHLSLFNGIGGFQLAAHWMGWENVASVEIDDFCNKVTKHHFPNCIQHKDIKEFDGTIYKGAIDIITGGFPCQDISASNFRAQGISGERSGLWSEYCRVISVVGPRFAVIENSPMLLKRGLENILFDLSEIGYNAQWECISAEAFRFPHKRERLFLIAYPASIGQQEARNLFENISNNTEVRDWEANDVIHAIQRKALPPLCNANHGFPDRLVKNGVKTAGNSALHALGNALMPQIAYQIFKAIDLTQHS